MEIEAKFALPDLDRFERLRVLDTLAGFHLSDEQVHHVRDTYLDTPTRQILSAGYVCRRRESEHEITITLKQLTARKGPVHHREELAATLPSDQPPAEWPASLVRDQILQLIGKAPLRPLFGLQQTRVVRTLTEGERTVAELSLDQVSMATDQREQAYLVLEVELAQRGTEDELAGIVESLQQEWDLTAEPRSKFERALAFFEENGSGIAAREQSNGEEEPDMESQSELAPAVAVEPTVETAEEVVPPSPKKPPKKPGLRADDYMAEAARKTLHLHFQRMLYHEPGTRQGEDTEELHDMRVATRRMRAAFRVFSDHLDAKETKPFRKGLRRTGRALGRVRDLDVFRAKLDTYVETLPRAQRASLDPLLAVWRAERDQTQTQMREHLESNRYRQFKEDFGTFLEVPSALPPPSKDDEPQSHRVRHVAPVAVYQRMAEMRAYHEWVTDPDVSLERLHRLRIAGKRLRYTLEFFREVLGPEVEAAIKELKGLQDHLGDLQDAVVASDLLRDFLTWGTWGHGQEMPAEPVVAPGVAAYLAVKQTEIQELLDTFPEAWAQIQGTTFRESVAAAVSAL